jgi:hypothetical protein
MNLQDLPDSLIKASQKIVETQDVLETCVSCGAVAGSCLHTEGENDVVSEDALSALNVPEDDEPEEQLSGDQEEIVINPEYKTFTSRRPQC